MRRDEQRLQDILEAISKIERFARDGRAEFEEDERVQVWMAHHVQIIGEAARACRKISGRDILKSLGPRS